MRIGIYEENEVEEKTVRLKLELNGSGTAVLLTVVREDGASDSILKISNRGLKRVPWCKETGLPVGDPGDRVVFDE